MQTDAAEKRGERLPPGNVRRFRFQFSLRTLLAAVFVCSVFLGGPSRIWLSARRQRVAVEAIHSRGGFQIKYDFEREGHSGPPHVPPFLVAAFGRDCFASVVHVKKISSPPDYEVDEELLLVKDFTHLDSLEVAFPSVSSAGLQTITSRDLRLLTISFSNFSGEGLSRLKCRRVLQELRLVGSSISDAGMREIATLESLQRLDLRTGAMPFGRCGIPARFHEDSLAQLVQLKNLKSLNLGGVELTDVGIGHLARLSTLESLVVHLRGGVTSPGLQQLRSLASLRQIAVDGGEPFKVAPGELDQVLQSIGQKYHLAGDVNEEDKKLGSNGE